MSGRPRNGSVAALSVALITGVAVMALAIPAFSAASFSGPNGKIFFEGPQSGTSGPTDVFSINPDGSE
jgi:hypothetical protein